MEDKRTKPSFTAATDEFIAASDWITPQHAPAIVALQLIAAQLDQELTAALVAQYGVTFRALLKEKPTATADDDPLEAALQAAT